MDEMNVMERRRLTVEEWRKHIDEQAKSGRKIIEYCRENGLVTNVFYRWRARLRELAAGPAGFVECRLRKPSVGSSVILECGNGYRLRIEAGFDERTLKRVLGVLAQC